jgi:hypothetical protein
MSGFAPNAPQVCIRLAFMQNVGPPDEEPK